MDFLQANWLWLLLGVAVAFLVWRRGGIGCGMGGLGSRGRDSDRHVGDAQDLGTRKEKEETSVSSRRRRGC